MERVFNHFVHRHVLPVFLLPVAAFGCLSLAFLSVAFQPDAPDQPFAIVCTTLGILGSAAATLSVIRAVWRRPSTWRVFELGRTAWVVLIAITWLAGAAGGIVVGHDFYEFSH